MEKVKYTGKSQGIWGVAILFLYFCWKLCEIYVIESFNCSQFSLYFIFEIAKTLE